MKKLIIFFIAALMLFNIFACAKTEENTEDKKDDVADAVNDNTEGDSETTPEPTVAPLVPDADINLNGRSIRIAAWWDPSPGERGKSESQDLYIDRRDLLEQKYNFKFEYINQPISELIANIQSSILAGEGMTEIFSIQMQMLIPMVTNGFVYPLSDLPELDINNDQRWSRSVREYTTLKGKVYGMSTNLSNLRGVVFFNERYLDEVNGPNIFDLQKNKQWTWDKMREIATMLTKDDNNDGVIDQYGLSSQDNRIDLAAVHSNGGGFIIYENGKFAYGLDDPRTLDALNFVQDLRYKQKVCEVADPSFQWDYNYIEFENGRAPMTVGEYWANGRIRDSLGEPFGVVAFPIGPQLSDYVSVGGDETYNVFASDIKDASAIAHIWKIYTDPVPIEQDEVDLNTLGHPRNLETYEMMKESGDLVINPVLLIPDFYNNNFWSVTYDLRANSKTPAAVADEYRDIITGYIRDTEAMLDGLK